MKPQVDKTAGWIPVKGTDFHGCLQCGGLLPPQPRGRPRKYCSEACSSAFWLVARRREPLDARICDECGAEFVPWIPTQRFCDNACGHKFHRRKSQQPWNARRRANYQKRRALKKSAPIGDPVLLSEVRERDGNRCGLCGKLVNGEVWPDPLSASLDHMVPLSQGGAHDPTNVQLAHLGCNVRKGARGGGEQLRII